MKIYRSKERLIPGTVIIIKDKWYNKLRAKVTGRSDRGIYLNTCPNRYVYTGRKTNTTIYTPIKAYNNKEINKADLLMEVCTVKDTLTTINCVRPNTLESTDNLSYLDNSKYYTKTKLKYEPLEF